MKLIEIKLKDKRVFRVNISDNQNISKLLGGLDVESYNIICHGVFDLTTFNKHKKQIKADKKMYKGSRTYQITINEKRVFVEYIPTGVYLYFNNNIYYLSETHKSTIKAILKKVIIKEDYHLLVKI